MFVFNILYQIKIYSEFNLPVCSSAETEPKAPHMPSIFPLSYIHILSLVSITSFKILYMFSFFIEFAMETQRMF